MFFLREVASLRRKSSDGGKKWVVISLWSRVVSGSRVGPATHPTLTARLSVLIN